VITHEFFQLIDRPARKKILDNDIIAIDKKAAFPLLLDEFTDKGCLPHTPCAIDDDDLALSDQLFEILSLFLWYIHDI
jgi:hypothetical protein